MVKVDELEIDVYMIIFQKKVEDKWSRNRNDVLGGIEKDWEALRYTMKVCVEEVCGRKRIGGVWSRGVNVGMKV